MECWNGKVWYGVGVVQCGATTCGRDLTADDAPHVRKGQL